MGFLLTSYNSLPEQVEANKEKCKDLQTQINNIDTHEIEQVKAQVQTNTQNIANVTQGLGVTNTALNAVSQDVNDLKPRVTNLETKTSNMSKSGVDTAFTESINVAKSINAGTNINAEGVIKGSSLRAENDNGVGNFHIDNDGDMSLYLPPNAGKLITTGNIEQYAPQNHLYRFTIGDMGFTIENEANEFRGSTIVYTTTDISEYLDVLENGTPQKRYNALISIMNNIGNLMTFTPNGDSTENYDNFTVELNSVIGLNIGFNGNAISLTNSNITDFVLIYYKQQLF